MEITQADWDRWKVDAVTREWFAMMAYRQGKIEKKMPPLIATGEPVAFNQSLVASGRHLELEDLIHTGYEDMKEGE